MNCAKIIRLLLLIFSVAFASCNKPDGEEDPTTNPGDNQKMQLVTNLNGYKFEGSFREPSDPIIYSDVSCNYVEEYNDGLRVLFSSRDHIMNNFRWYAKELKNGKVVQEFNTIQGIDLSPDNYVFAFDNSSFLLYGYDKANSVIITYKPDGTKSGYYVSKPNNHFPYHFDENYTVFWGNASTVYVHENKNHSYTPPAPNMGFLLTNELSVSIAAYLFDDDIVNPYSFRDNIYTAFFNPTYDKGNYIGIAKGSVTLDTLVVNRYDPTLYSGQLNSVYISKAGNKYYLWLTKIKARYGDNDLSLYEMDATEQVIRPIFTNKNPAFGSGIQFVNGKFYTIDKVWTTDTQFENIPLPSFVEGAGANRVFYGKTKRIILVQKNLDLIEIYSKPY